MKRNAFLDQMRKKYDNPEIKKQVDMQVGVANRIYEILEERNMSQKDLARLLGKTENEVSRWLSGTHNITFATLAKITCALETDIIQVTSKPVMVRFTVTPHSNYAFQTSSKMEEETEFMVAYK